MFPGMLRLLASIAVLLLVPAATARAARPFTITVAGANPHVAMEANGTAHVTWNHDLPSGGFETHYCRVPRSSRRCAPGSERVFGPFNARDYSAEPVVLLGAPRLVVVVTSDSPPTGSSTVRYVSLDGGKTFDGGAVIGTLRLEAAALGGNGTVGLAGVGDDSAFQLASLSAPAAGLAPITPGANSGDQELVFADPAHPLVLVGTGEDSYAVKRWSGVGSPNDGAQWLPVTSVRSLESDLVHGKRGTYLVTGTGLTPSRFSVRSYDARRNRFRRPRSLGIRGSFAAAATDRRGDVHIALDGRTGIEERATRGRRLGPIHTLFRHQSSAYSIDLAVARPGRGLVVWSSAAGGSEGRIRAVRL